MNVHDESTDECLPTLSVGLAKCPICKLRVSTVTTLGKKRERSCSECAHLHFRRVEMDIDGTTVSASVYIDTNTILAERKEQKRLLDEQRRPKDTRRQK